MLRSRPIFGDENSLPWRPWWAALQLKLLLHETFWSRSRSRSRNSIIISAPPKKPGSGSAILSYIKWKCWNKEYVSDDKKVSCFLRHSKSKGNIDVFLWYTTCLFRIQQTWRSKKPFKGTSTYFQAIKYFYMNVFLMSRPFIWYTYRKWKY